MTGPHQDGKCQNTHHHVFPRLPSTQLLFPGSLCLPRLCVGFRYSTRSTYHSAVGTPLEVSQVLLAHFLWGRFHVLWRINV